MRRRWLLHALSIGAARRRHHRKEPDVGGDVPLLKRSRFLGLFIKPLLDALVMVNQLFLRAHVAPH